MKINLRQCYLYFYIFMLIYIEFGYHMVVENQLSGSIRTVVLIAISIPLVLFGKKNLTADILFFVFYLTAVALLNCIFRLDEYGNYILLLVPIFIGFVTVLSVDKNEYVKVYSNIVFFLSVFSLVVFVINLVAQPIIASLPLVGYRNAAQVHDAFFSVAITNSQYIRNYGIAWEPGAFAILIGLAMYFELIHTEKIRIKRIIFLTVAMITTFSTMGYFFTALLFAAVGLNYLFTHGNIMHSNKRNAVIIILIISVMIVFFLPQEAKSLVFSKLDGLFNDTGDISSTTEARINAIIYPLRAFLESPLVGVGYDQFSFINKTQCDSVATNTIINWFALFGLSFGLPCTYCYFKCFYNDKQKFNIKLLPFIILIIAFCLLVSTESLLRISLIYILIFYGVQADRDDSQTRILPELL